MHKCFGYSYTENSNSVYWFHKWLYQVSYIGYCLFYRYPGTVTKVLNLGSYNYLGFAETSGPCIDDVVKRINDDGVGSCSCRKDLGIV